VGVKQNLLGPYRLRHLDISNSNVNKIDSDAFDDVRNLSVLDLRGSNLKEFHPKLFDGIYLEVLQTDSFSLCCDVKDYSKRCTPPGDEFSSCGDLMAKMELKVAIWILGSVSFMSNIAVIVFRCTRKKANEIEKILVINLSISDFCMGVYLLTIGFADIYFKDVYYKYEVTWRSSPICKFAGIICFVSSEMSVFTLVFITCERVLVVAFPFRFSKTTRKILLVSLSLAWLATLALAILPLLIGGVFGTYYGQNGVCLSFGISRGELLVQDVFNLVILSINLIGFMIILIGHLVILDVIRKSSRRMRGHRRGSVVNKEIIFLRKMSLIVMTDFICWVPIIIIKFLEFNGFHFPAEITAWTAVFVLPLNSAINPFLYTNQIVESITKAIHRSKDYSSRTHTDSARSESGPAIG
jgi:hypothetical protein